MDVVESKWYEMDMPLNDVKKLLSANIKTMSRSFIAAGYYMKYIRDRELFRDGGYNSIWEFAEDQYGIKKSAASRWMAMNDKFSKDGNSPILDDKYNDNNVMIDEIDIAKKTLDGLLDDRRYFALLYEPDDDLKQGEAWQTDDRAIYQSNPVAVSHQYIFDEIKKKRTLAVLYENKRENYLCKHNNILYKGLGVEGYIDIQKVKLCRIQPDPQWWNGRQVWVGVDLSQTDDNTAVAMVTEDNGYIYARVMGFIPKEKINIKTQKEHVDYQRMISKGECIACGEEVIDYSVVENYVIHLLEEEYGVIVEQVGYDRYNAISSVQKMEAEGLECVEIKQHSSVLHQPTKWLKELILQQAFRYEENRLLEINFQNARCTEDTNLNKYVNKKKSTGKVDEVVALINAMYLLQQYLLNGDNFVAQTA